MEVTSAQSKEVSSSLQSVAMGTRKIFIIIVWPSFLLTEERVTVLANITYHRDVSFMFQKCFYAKYCTALCVSVQTDSNKEAAGATDLETQTQSLQLENAGN